MTDEEVRARLRRLEAGDPVDFALEQLGALQFGGILLFAAPPEGYWRWIALAALAIIPIGLLQRKLGPRFVVEGKPDAVRKRYEEKLNRSLRRAGGWSALWGVFLALSVLCGAMAISLLQKPDRNPMGVPCGVAISIGCLLRAVRLRRQRTKDLPRLEREKAEFEGAAQA